MNLIFEVFLDGYERVFTVYCCEFPVSSKKSPLFFPAGAGIIRGVRVTGLRLRMLRGTSFRFMGMSRWVGPLNIETCAEGAVTIFHACFDLLVLVL